MTEPQIGHHDLVSSLAFNPDGSLLASAGEDGTIRYWDPTTGTPFGEPMQDPEGIVSGLVWSPDGKRLAASGHFGGVRIWEALSERDACELAVETLDENAVSDLLRTESPECVNRVPVGGLTVPLVPVGFTEPPD